MDFDAKFERVAPELRVDLAAVREALPDRSIEAMTPLGGGFANANFALDLAGGERLVLRIGARGAAVLTTEVAVLRRVAPILPVPEVVGQCTEANPLGRPFALQRFVAGRPLCSVEDGLPAAAVADLASELGRLLARLHGVELGAPGFFASSTGGELHLEPRFDHLRVAWDAESERCLASSPVRERLGGASCDALACHLQALGDVLWSGLPQGGLTHADFNQKNILVEERGGRWHVAAILDWEFAFAGTGLVDLGNFLRFEDEQPAYAAPLGEGYRSAGGILPEDWRVRARALDLLPMLQFLAMEASGPRTVASARRVVERTLALDAGR